MIFWFVLHFPWIRIELISWILQNVYLRYNSFHSIKQIVRFSSSEIKKCAIQSSASFKLYAFIRTISNELILFPELHLHVKISFYFYAISLLDFIGGYILYVSVSTPLKHLWIIITELIFYEIQLYFAYIISYTNKIISMHFMEKFYHKLRHLLEQ